MSLGPRRVCVPTASVWLCVSRETYKVEQRKIPRYSRVSYHQKGTRTLRWSRPCKTTRARPLPCAAKASIRVRRTRTSAYSAATKNAFTSTNTTTMNKPQKILDALSTNQVPPCGLLQWQVGGRVTRVLYRGLLFLCVRVSCRTIVSRLALRTQGSPWRLEWPL